MTSLISKEDIEDELVKAGIRSVIIRAHLLRMVELYARRFQLSDPDLPDVDFRDKRGYKYQCPKPPKGCGQRKPLSQFPEMKKTHPRSPIPCIECTRKVDALTSRS